MQAYIKKKCLFNLENIVERKSCLVSYMKGLENDGVTEHYI